MEFDEYEYLEKTVEPSVPSTNGSGEKDRGGSRRRSSGGGGGRDDEERGSKRSRPGEDRDRDRHRGGGREHRDRDDGKEKERSSRSRGKDGEKDRSKEAEKDRGRDRDRDSERDRRRERDSGRERRSSSRPERRRTEEEEMVRELQKERERSDRNRDYRDRDVRRRKDDGAEPEADPERDQRTVFAFQLSLKADERDVYEFFSRAGKVRDVRLIMDRNSRRSKGVGYIEFYDAMSVPMAIALTGQVLLGQQVMVKPSEAEKNLVQSNVASGGIASGGARKLYVGNLHSNITEDQLRQVFEPFGQVELVQLPFARLEDAKAAQSLNGQLDIAGRVIKVSAVTEQAGLQVGGATTGDLDDDEGGGLALNASSRAMLMRKLDRSGTATSITGGIGIPGVNTSVELPSASVTGAPLPPTSLIQPTVPAIGTVPVIQLPGTQSADIGSPTEFLLLKNMFDPSVETDPDFDLDIKDDVQDECSKFGAVNHIFVDKNTAGFVYLHFDSVAAATAAQRALHGRWFAGKMITATFMTAQQYKMKFPN
uniref:RRM domain-containing protein n=1 Tax=Oryza punctata TaxID=4537 RepID=A0A0E0M817_ORYPU